MREKIPLAGVIGHPVDHSRSPRLHGYWLRSHGIEGYYVPLDIGHEKLENAVAALPDLGFVGVNVTIPHKERVVRLADFVSDRAALIGAANTLTFRSDGRVYADNTDGLGFLTNLKQTTPGWQEQNGHAVVLGAGGAARAVTSALFEGGASEVAVSNRTRARAEALQKDFGPRVTVHDWIRAGNILEGASIVVNTTSLGMAGKPPLRVPLDGLSPNAVVADLVYTPLKTQFLQDAAALGCRTVDGLGMLIHQAIPCFERWFGQRPDADDRTRAVILGA